MFDDFFPSSEINQVAQAAEVADVIAAACAAGQPVYPVGGGTSLGLGAAVEEPGTVLSLGKLNELIDYPSRDLTITVEAGMTMAELAGHLAAENQRLPMDVAHPESATVGGVVAANLSGPRRYRFGTMRDYLLGLTAVDGTGKVFSAGGRVVKNAAGYDLTRLMIGSLGTLGVITQVTLMVRPRPEMSAFAVIPTPSLEKADRLLESLSSAEIEPTAIEFLSSTALLEGSDSEAADAVWVCFEGSEPEVQWMLDIVKRLGREQGMDVDLKDVSPDGADSIWQGLTERSAAAVGERPDSMLGVEVTVLPSKTIKAAACLREIDEDVSLHCRAGNGVLLGRFACGPSHAAELATKIRLSIHDLGGNVVVTAYPPESRLDREMVWGAPGDEMRVMQRVKQQFDPGGILNPGRFIFERPSANVNS